MIWTNMEKERKKDENLNLNKRKESKTGKGFREGEDGEEGAEF